MQLVAWNQEVTLVLAKITTDEERMTSLIDQWVWSILFAMHSLSAWVSVSICGNHIIIICHYNPLWVFTFSAKSLQVLLSLAVSFQFLTFSFFRSSITSTCHHCLGLPTGLVPIGLQSNSFAIGLAWSIHCICPSHLILCALMNPTISSPSINLSISMLFCIFHILSILTGPNIFLSICLLKIVANLTHQKTEIGARNFVK